VTGAPATYTRATVRRTSGPLPAWLTVVGAALLVGSLFLTWSHQLPAAERRVFHGAVLYGVPANPDALQVYAIAGEVLGLLAGGVAAAGLWGQRLGSALALAAVAVGLAFVIHARSAPPTNGLLLATGVGAGARYVIDPATPGPGETLALVGLGVGAVGLLAGAVGRAPTA
jgi:hypothetical protein